MIVGATIGRPLFLYLDMRTCNARPYNAGIRSALHIYSMEVVT